MIIVGVSNGVVSLMIDYRDLKALKISLACTDVEEAHDILAERGMGHHIGIVGQVMGLINSLEETLGDAPKTTDERIMDSLKSVDTKTVN